MRNTVPITVVGNLTADPELRFTGNIGTAVCKFTAAVNPRLFDKTTSQWKDGDASFYRCQAWGQLAENLADCLHKGDRVLVVGVLQQRTWTDKDTNQPRSSWEITAEEAGPSLTYATAAVRKSTRTREETPPDDPWNDAAREPAAAGADLGPGF